jgi:uncharacterized membrane protein
VRRAALGAGIAIAALAAGACGRRDRGATPASGTSGQRPPAPPPGASFRAAGTEPFWALEIRPGRLVFRTPDDTAGTQFPHPASTTRGDTLRWTDVAGARSIEALVWPGQCSDGMSDRAWTHRAAVRVDTLTYRGCADQT